MPTYDYKCPECEHKQEDFHWINQKPEVKCEECGTIMEQQISGCGLVFKGTGFYSTDYKHPSEHRASVRKTVKSIAQGDQNVIHDMVGDAKKRNVENKKQQKTSSTVKNMPVKRRGS